MEDGATVPLYYENRIPELQLTNENLNEDMEELLEAADLDEDQEKKLEREFAREYHLITRDERLETIAQDLVWHFISRGYRGKAMMVCIDKATAVKMYDKVQMHWQSYLAELKAELAAGQGRCSGKPSLPEISFMESTDMAVVVSQSQNEVEDLRRRDWTSRRTASAWFRKTWKRSSKTRTATSAWSSCAPCGSPALTCPPAPRSTSISR